MVRTGENAFARQVRQTPSWTVCIHRHENELHAFSEYAHLVEAVTRDPAIPPQLEVLVGSPLGQRRIDLPTIVDGLMTQVADRTHELRFDEATLLDLYGPMERALYDEFIEYEAIAPVQNLRSLNLPVRLDSETVIDVMTDEEIAECIQSGLIVSPFGDFGMVFLTSNCGVRRRHRLPKVVGEAPAELREEAVSMRARFEDTLLGLITALRLFKAGEITSPGFIEYSPNWFMRGHISWQPLGSKRRVGGDIPTVTG